MKRERGILRFAVVAVLLGLATAAETFAAGIPPPIGPTVLEESVGLGVAGTDGGTPSHTEPGTAPSATGGPPEEVLVPLAPYAVHVGRFDYIAAGAAMRNQGYGYIDVPWAGTLVAAYLVWAIMDIVPSTTGTINGVTINGTVVATNPVNPCWDSLIHTLVADVTPWVVPGVNTLSDFPSGLTTGVDPFTWRPLPLLEGASLVVITDTGGPIREIGLHLGADTLRDSPPPTSWFMHGAATAIGAKTTFIVADGQLGGNYAEWNSVVIDSEAFPGMDPRVSPQPWTYGNLWDTRTYPVAVAVGSIADSAVIGSTQSDCLTWIGQVVRVDVDVPSSPPTAVAQASPIVAYMGDPITFDGTASTDDEGIVMYMWDFGDAGTSPDAVTSHAYAARGSFTATLTVWDADFLSDTDTVVVEIVNRPPVANAGPDAAVLKRSVVGLDGSSSADPDGDPLTIIWSQAEGPAVALSGADTATPTFTPPTTGTYTFTLVVVDPFGKIGTDTVAITATNRAPLADAGPDATVGKHTAITLDGSTSADPDGDPLTFAWTQTAGPSVILADAGTVSPTATLAAIGTYTFHLAVDDGDGGTAEDTVAITVTGLPPVARIVATPIAAVVGTPIEFDGSGSEDPDGTIVTYAFDFADGTQEGDSGAVRSHAFPSPGTYRVTLTVTDDDGMGNSTEVVVEVEIAAVQAAAPGNWKPVVAAVFAAILLLAGSWSARRAPWRGGNRRGGTAIAFALTSLPFVLAEAATGVVSHYTGALSIPPVFGVGLLVDGAILAAGLAVAGMRARTRKSAVMPAPEGA